MSRNGAPRATNSEGLPQNQITALEALSAGATATEAAVRAGVNRTTVYRWLREDPVFVAKLNRSRLEQRQSIQAEIRGLAREALATLRSLLNDTNTPAAVRLKTALSVLEGVGGIQPESIGATEPEKVRWGWKQAEVMEKLASFGA